MIATPSRKATMTGTGVAAIIVAVSQAFSAFSEQYICIPVATLDTVTYYAEEPE